MDLGVVSKNQVGIFGEVPEFRSSLSGVQASMWYAVLFLS
jgi:hypothetical protein